MVFSWVDPFLFNYLKISEVSFFFFSFISRIHEEQLGEFKRRKQSLVVEFLNSVLMNLIKLITVCLSAMSAIYILCYTI